MIALYFLNFDAFASLRYLLGRSSLFRLALLLISLFSSVFKSAVGMLLIPTGEGCLYACHRSLSNYFFMFFFGRIRDAYAPGYCYG